jgi:hypothetical protein
MKGIWATGMTTLIVITASSAMSSGFRRIPVSRCEGNELPILDISPRYGLTISLIKVNQVSGELIQQVRISDPSRVVLDTDTKLGSKNGTTGEGATIVFLRQLSKPLDISAMRLQPQARRSQYLMLSLVTATPSNKRRLCQFRLHLNQESSQSTIEVIP